MKRALLASLTLIALGWMAGCGGGSILSSGSTGGTTSPAALNGQYAFVLSGFDSTANSMSMAGSFKADGLGHITGGAVDVNDNGVISSSNALAGTYTIGSNQQGVITLTNAVGTLPHTLAFGFSLQTSGAFGDIMDLDTNNFIADGTMQQQNSGIFSFSGLAGDYIITLNGRSASNATSALGRFTLASNGVVSNATFDRSVAGSGSSGAITGGSASVTFNSAPDANGRGTLTVSINDTPLVGNTAQTFLYYAINANRFVAVENDATGTMTADASRQLDSTPFTATTVNTTGAVFGMAGIDTFAAPVPNEISAVGQLQILTSNVSPATLALDSNDNGVPVSIPVLPGQTVAFDPTTGRGTIAVAGGTADGLADKLVFYLSAPGTGFILDGTLSTTNRAMAGTLTPQTGSPFSTATDFANAAIVRARGSSVNDAQNFVGVFLPVGGTPYELVTDERAPTNTGIQTATNVPISFSANLSSATTGRGTLVTGAGETLVFYVIGPSQFTFVNTTQAEGASPVFFASPQ